MVIPGHARGITGSVVPVRRRACATGWGNDRVGIVRSGVSSQVASESSGREEIDGGGGGGHLSPRMLRYHSCVVFAICITLTSGVPVRSAKGTADARQRQCDGTSPDDGFWIRHLVYCSWVHGALCHQQATKPWHGRCPGNFWRHISRAQDGHHVVCIVQLMDPPNRRIDRGLLGLTKAAKARH
nr:hypothetical protein CFP56_00829 [Quercus suber]